MDQNPQYLNTVQSSLTPQYIYTTMNALPQPQMIIPHDAQPLPQPAMLIQPQQPHYLIPIYHDNLGVNLDQNVVQLHYVPTQQPQNGDVFLRQNQVEDSQKGNAQFLIETSPQPLTYQEGENNVFHGQTYNTISHTKENLENQALFSDTDTQVKYSKKGGNEVVIDEKQVGLEVQGEFGAKIKLTPVKTTPQLINTRQKQKFEDNAQLIDRTKSLVSGVDVLNINEAISNTINTGDTFESAQFNYEVSTARPTSRTKLINILNTEKVEDPISFKDNPIVVPDIDYQDNAIQSTTASSISDTFYSTTRNTIETEINNRNPGITDSSILITPKPISSSFLTPITAAVTLQNSAESQNVVQQLKSNTIVEVQKSIPYYVGKVELIENSPGVQEHLVTVQNPKSEALIQDHQFMDNVKVNQHIQEEQELSIHFPLKTKLSPVAVLQPYPGEATNIVEKPVEVVKIVEKPVPVEVKVPYGVPIEVPVTVEKQVPVPVEKIVEKPVEVTRIIEKPVPVHVPQPYAVEVERIVEKEVQVPYEVTKYVEKPVPVHIPVPHPVAVPVEVEKVVEKIIRQPYRVEVPIRVEVPVKVPVPHPVPVTKFIEKPYPVEKIVEKPVKVEKIVEKPVTKYVNRPYPVHIRIPVPTPVAVPVEVKVPFPYAVEIPKYLNHIPQDKPYGAQALSYRFPFQKQLSSQSINIPVSIAPTKLQQVSFDINKYKPQHLEPISPYHPLPTHSSITQKILPNPYQYAPKYQPHWKNINCDYHISPSTQIRSSKALDFVGLVPPLPPHNVFYRHVDSKSYTRRPRQSFGSNLRVEYGFKPPLIPSVETDEHGTPIEKDDE